MATRRLPQSGFETAGLPGIGKDRLAEGSVTCLALVKLQMCWPREKRCENGTRLRNCRSVGPIERCVLPTQGPSGGRQRVTFMVAAHIETYRVG